MAKKYDNDFKVMLVELLKSGRKEQDLVRLFMLNLTLGNLTIAVDLD